MENEKQAASGKTIWGYPAREWINSFLKHVFAYAAVLTIAMLLLLYANR
jgi:hypothetical protein